MEFTTQNIHGELLHFEPQQSVGLFNVHPFEEMIFFHRFGDFFCQLDGVVILKRMEKADRGLIGFILLRRGEKLAGDNGTARFLRHFPLQAFVIRFALFLAAADQAIGFWCADKSDFSVSDRHDIHARTLIIVRAVFSDTDGLMR